MKSFKHLRFELRSLGGRSAIMFFKNGYGIYVLREKGLWTVEVLGGDWKGWEVVRNILYIETASDITREMREIQIL